MNVGQILERVELLINRDGLTDAQIVTQMNELSRKLFRKFPVPEEIYKFTTTETPYYMLPADCTEERIRCVVIDDIEYKKVSPDYENPPSNFCTVFVGSIYLNPNQAGKEAYLFYGQRPIELSSDRLDETPNFPEDYHDLYVYDAAKWIAGIQRDVDMRNNFQAEFDGIMVDAERNLRKMGLKKARTVINW